MQLTNENIKWLWSRGGRTPDDVRVSLDGSYLFVFMGKYNDEKVPVGELNYLCSELNLVSKRRTYAKNKNTPREEA